VLDLEEIPREIRLVQPLLNDHLVPGGEVIQARGHATVPPFNGAGRSAPDSA
jgi:hypothetical protein